MNCEYCNMSGDECYWAGALDGQMSYLNEEIPVERKFSRDEALEIVNKWETEILPRCANSGELEAAIERAKEKIQSKYK